MMTASVVDGKWTAVTDISARVGESASCPNVDDKQGEAQMTPQNMALWLPKARGRFEVGPAPYIEPAADEVVVRAHAIAVNPIDAAPGFAYRVILPWLTFPAVVGSDVAGEVVEVGSEVTRLRPGDRVVGHAAGIERNRNRAAEGAFQLYVVLMQHMVAPIPDDLSFERAAVLPMAVSTAASGMFQQDQLALRLPTTDPKDRGETVVVWGGSTSVGSNAIQLARHAGYRVVATASPHNFDYSLAGCRRSRRLPQPNRHQGAHRQDR
jgi:NADPH:quinone reductase-like Zn-dependent oxidoreductase